MENFKESETNMEHFPFFFPKIWIFQYAYRKCKKA